MATTYYQSDLTKEQIEQALHAINGVASSTNNGKVLYIDENGEIKAKSAAEWTTHAVLQPGSASANGDFLPPSGVDGFSSFHVDVESYPEPTGTLNISENGLVNVKDYAEANVQVSGGSNIEVIPLSATENTTYTAPAGKAYSPVTVNVSGGGGGSGDWPFMDDITDGGTGFVAEVSGSETLDVNALPANVKTFYNEYARTPKPTTVDYNIEITEDDAGLTLAELKAAHRPKVQMEYYGNVYGNTSMIEALGLVLLGDFSQGGAATGNALSGSINDYSAVILQGIYQKQRGSNYNTSMLYITNGQLNANYWAGMKDRNTTYDCFVTFTDNQTVSLTGNKQVIIYGVP